MSLEIYDPFQSFEEKIKAVLAEILSRLEIAQPVQLEYPSTELGDFAFPCFRLASNLKKDPKLIAKQILGQMPQIEGLDYELKGPYINFRINRSKLVELVIKTISKMDSHYGERPENDIKIILEHTSANPTDKLHVGRARNPIIGDTLARVLRCAGYLVETQYYVDDMGKQNARKVLESRHRDWDREKFKTGYQWATSATSVSSEYYDISKENELNQIMDGLEGGNQQILNEAEKVCKSMMDDIIIPSLERMNITIDKYVNESQFMLDNSVNEIVDKLKNSDYNDIEDGAYFIDLTQFESKSGKDKFFFVRADGKSLYATRDIAYHHWKFKHCDVAINILGEDHKLESEYVRVGLQLTGSDQFPENIFYAFVNLPEGRMSTRKGKVVYIDDLLDEAERLAKDEVKKRREDLTEPEIEKIAAGVGIGAVRYNIIKVQAEKKIVFRWEDALNFEGDSAPFIQYAHARACSILRKAKESGIKINQDELKIELINNNFEHELVRILVKLPGIVFQSSEKRAPHILAGYAHELAAGFNQFYRECPVLQAGSQELVQARLALVDATRIVLHNTLELLGIDAPERM